MRAFFFRATNLAALGLAFVAAVGVFGASKARAGQTTLTFEGLQNGESVDNFYNGGLGSDGSGPGPSDGITFDASGRAFIDKSGGGTGPFSNNPSGDTALSFNFDPALNLNGSIMNVQNGFTGSLSGSYASSAGDEIEIFSGANLTGTMLADVDLANTPLNFADPNGPFDTFETFDVSFAGTAHSAYIGAVGASFFDDLTLNTLAPSGSSVPLPNGALCGLGLLGAVIVLVRRRAIA